MNISVQYDPNRDEYIFPNGKRINFNQFEKIISFPGETPEDKMFRIACDNLTAKEATRNFDYS